MLTLALTAIPILLSGAAVAVSLSMMVDSYRRGITDELREVLRAFHTADVRDARLVARRVARAHRVSKRQRAEFEDAALTIMWAIQAVQPSLRHVRKTALVVEEATVLYHHIGSAAADLATALNRHGMTGSRIADVRATNAALDGMPPVHDSWDKTVAEPPSVRLPEGRGSRHRVAR